MDINTDIKNFTEVDIKRITCNYMRPIGRGGFGEVFKGVLDDDDLDLVAVKRYIHSDLREDFMQKVSIHSQMSHKNVVKLLGYCVGKNSLIMVTEYVSGGNLDEILHNSDIYIPLDTRLGIAIGCAEALRYMHSMHLSSDSLVCHGDIKPANILLDKNLIAKVSDFGLSRCLLGGITQYTVHVKGSLDYMDPMYLREGRLSPKCDVYSFGVVLLELIARKRVKQGDINLIGAFSQATTKGKQLKGLYDQRIAHENNMKTLEEVAKIATECLTLDIAKRPQMNDVVERLRMLRKFQEGWLQKPSRRYFWGTQNALQKDYKPGTSISSPNSLRTKNLGIFKRTVDYSVNLKEFNVKLFTKEEIIEVTNRFSFKPGRYWSDEISKGTLEDNTLVAVKKYCQVNEVQKYEFIREATILSQILHKNIAKLLGCCLESDTPILVYEYASKGNLYDVVNGYEEFPLGYRLKIAIMTAKALDYLYSSGIGLIRHGCFLPSNISLDDNFMPKVIPNCLSVYRCCAATTTDPIGYLSDEMNYMDPIYLNTGSLTDKTDVYSFGIALLELISRKSLTFMMHDNEYYRLLIPEFIEAYKEENSGYALFDVAITAAEEIATLDGMGRLAIRCISLDIDERPSMKEVAECLETLRRCWHSAANATASGTSGTQT